MKSVRDMQSEMSDLYDQLKDGKVELKLASEMANIAGKYFKAEALIFAREMFLAERGRLGATVDVSSLTADLEEVRTVKSRKGNAVTHPV